MNDLKIRYVEAVLASIPEKRRGDVARELGAAIDDAVEQRMDAGEDETTALNSVLVEFGDPIRLAADYSDRPLYLIGPTYYVAWLKMMRLLLSIVVPFAGAASFLVQLATSDGALASAILSGLWVAFVAALNVVFWVTLGFVVSERSEAVSPDDIAPLTRWTPRDLDAVPARQFSRVEVIGSLVVIALVIGVIVGQRGIAIPFLNPAAWDVVIPVMLVLLVVSASLEFVKLKAGRWTQPLAVTNAILNAGYAAWWVWALVDGDLLNPEFFSNLGWSEGLRWATWSTVAVVVCVCAWSAVEGFVGLRRANLTRRAVQA